MSSRLPVIEVDETGSVTHGDPLDWSVSGISGLSGTLEKNNLLSELSSSHDSSRLGTPDGSQLQLDQVPSADLKEVEKLLNAMQSLVTPNSSGNNFQSLQVELTQDEDDPEDDRPKTPIAPKSNKPLLDQTNTTPPVKDPGLTPKTNTVIKRSLETSSSAQKLDHMRSRLMELEVARNLMATNNGGDKTMSRIPRRSLSFNSDSSQSRGSQSRQLALNSTATSSQSSNTKDCTVVEKKEDIPDISPQVKELEVTIQALELENSHLRTDLGLKDKILTDKDSLLTSLRNQWSQALQRWSQERDLNVNQIQEKEVALNELQDDLNSLREHVTACENELERALSFAHEFKSKLDEEESAKEKLLLDREKIGKNLQELARKVQEMGRDKESLQQELLSQRTKNTDLEVMIGQSKDSTTKLKTDFMTERRDFQIQIADLETRQESLEDQLKQNQTLESNLHDFYQSQMETILGEKVGMLQNHVEQLEQTMIQEREDLVKQIHSEHSQQLDELRERFAHEVQALVGQYSEQKSTLEASLRAARQEADCLREQLRLSERKASHELGDFFKPLTFARSSEQRIRAAETSDSSSVESAKISKSWTRYQKNLSVGLKSLETSGPNNLRTSLRTMAQSTSLERSSTTLQHSLDSTELGDVLTMEEREDIVKQFISQFLRENPNAVHDKSLMEGLDSMSSQMVQKPSLYRPNSRHQGAKLNNLPR